MRIAYNYTRIEVSYEYVIVRKLALFTNVGVFNNIAGSLVSSLHPPRRPANVDRTQAVSIVDGEDVEDRHGAGFYRIPFL